jgi:hypothetical protein
VAEELPLTPPEVLPEEELQMKMDQVMKFINRHYDTIDVAGLEEMLAEANSRAASAKKRMEIGIDLCRTEQQIQSRTIYWKVSYTFTFLDTVISV